MATPRPDSGAGSLAGSDEAHGSMGAPGLRAFRIGGVLLYVDKNAQAMHVVDAHGHTIQLPPGAHFNAQKNTVDLPGGDHLTFSGGQPIRNTPRHKADKLSGTTYDQNPYTGPHQKITLGMDTTPTPKPVRHGVPGPVPRGQAPGSAPLAPPSAPARTTPKAAPQPAAPPPAALSGRTSAPAPSAVPAGSGAVYSAIARAAQENGVPLALALAIAQHESGFDAGNRTGDNGKSWGLYQLEDTGEGAGMGNTRLDPYTNASTALRVVGEVLRQHPDYSWGQVAAAAQRPKYPQQYAQTIDGIVNAAKTNPNYFSTALAQHGGGGTGVTVGSAPLPTAAGEAAVSGSGNSTVADFDPKKFAAALASAGFTAHLINSNPELKQAFQHAVATQQSADDFQAAIQNTHWYQARTSSQRAYDLSEQSDHATLSRQVQAESASIQAKAVQLGVTISPLRAHDLAVTALRNGLTPEELQKSIAAELHYNPKASYGGTFGTSIDQLKKAAADYFVQLDDKTLGQFAQQIAAGTSDMTKFTQFLQQQAASKYSWLKPQLDQGFTVSQLASPYKTSIAQNLELDPNTISNSDPLLQRGLQMSDGKGGYSTMPLYQFDQTVKSDPRWLKTNSARNGLMDVGVGVLQDMGLHP